MENYVVKGKVTEATLENGKVVKISTEYLERMIANLDDVYDMDDAVLVWLEEEGYVVNEELEELCKKEKVKTVNRAERKPKEKTQKERTVKENPTKEAIIAALAKTIGELEGATDIVIENKGKIVTFKMAGEEFKIDLVQKRKPKTK